MKLMYTGLFCFIGDAIWMYINSKKTISSKVTLLIITISDMMIVVAPTREFEKENDILLYVSKLVGILL